MLQFSNLEDITIKDIPKLVSTIQPELRKRKDLYLRYKRKEQNSDIIYGSDNKKTKITFEKYITDISAGYLGGTAPKYVVNQTTDENKKSIIKKILDRIVGQNNYKEEMEILIDYITNYNDDGAEHYQLVKDLLMTSACYEIIYENEDNEIIYSRLNPLQTIAIWDYSVPVNLIGLVRMWESKEINGKTFTNVQIISKSGIKEYKGTSNSYELVDERANNWKDVPALAVEQEEGTAIFETVVDVIKAYEQLIQNCRNTFQYNDEAKLVIAGYNPQNPLTITKEIKDDKGNITGYEVVENPDRQAEDEVCLKAKVVYLGIDGNVAWVEKDVKDTAVQNTLKTYIDLIAMNTGVPNITDLGFTNADNASAIDRKFFALEQMTIGIVKQLEKAYLRRWELIFDRLNLKKKSEKNIQYDFRDISVILSKNVPQNNKEMVDTWLRLRGLISDETIIDNLPYDLDPNSEKKKMDSQEEEELDKEVNKINAFNKVQGANIEENASKEKQDANVSLKNKQKNSK